MNVGEGASRLIIASPDASGRSAPATGSAAITEDFTSALLVISKYRKSRNDDRQADAPNTSMQQIPSVAIPVAQAMSSVKDASAAAIPGDRSPVGTTEGDANELASKIKTLALVGDQITQGRSNANPPRAPSRESAAPYTVASAQPAAEVEQSTLLVRVESLQTFLPVVISQALTAAPAHSQLTPAHAPQVDADALPASSPLKMLRMQIEPASLGSLSIKMRVSKTHVEIEIEAQTPATAALLSGTREKLAEAISRQGLSLDVGDIKVSQAQNAASVNDESASRGGGGSSGERGYADGEPADRRQRQANSPNESRPPDQGVARSRFSGLFL